MAVRQAIRKREFPIPETGREMRPGRNGCTALAKKRKQEKAGMSGMSKL